MAKDGPGSSLPRRQLGRYLRRGRIEANLTLEQVGSEMEWSISKLGRIERGEIGKLTSRDVEALCGIVGFDAEMTAAMIGLNKQAAEKSWWHSFGDLIPEGFNVYVGLETSAHVMDVYRPDVVPGLLQTADYARALDRIYFPDDSEEEQERRVQLRCRRQTIVTRKSNPTKVGVVLHESVLHTNVGGPAVMAAQLRHLADIGTRDNLAIRVLPFSAGLPVGTPTGPFVILDFATDRTGGPEPTVVYVENFTGDMYFEGESDVRHYRAASAALQRAALDEVTSRTLMRQVARRGDRGWA
ncbi:helix-turn-helix domain-containing protein [Nocardia otitidiscaviarum]|uniref:helix-turn-helix domain-containing protein n=1 Tax=Nocardia otitidiscaviarum TaxID=1823 RepID=UPI001895F448|nr:helix-turn-helix transcriptional regulator [Nocardia otitidiscaviarum]MBF6183518.1 helix-turn-helix domain-containing protein [Nocardia otitidiscaviarum]